MGLDRSLEPTDDHLVAHVAPRLRSGRDAAPALETARPAQGPPRSHPVRRGLTRPAGRPAFAALFLIAAIGACTPSAPPSAVPSTSPITTATPVPTGTGVLHLTTESSYDPHFPLELQYRFADGKLAADVDSVLAETVVDVDRELPVGTIRVVANGKDCQGEVDIQSKVEVDVTFAQRGDDSCTVTTDAAHPVGSIEHPEPRTTINAFLPAHSELVVRALDPGSDVPEIRRPASDSGEVEGIEVAPGRYELTVLVDGEILTSKELDVIRGSSWFENLRVLGADVERDCGEVDASLCELAIAEAYAWGLFAGPASVAAVQLRPTKYTGGCMPQTAAVTYDVTFALVNPTGEIEVTVGRYPDGRLVACTY